MKSFSMKKYRIWLLLACALLAGIWWMLFIIVSLSLSALLNHFALDTHPGVYDTLLSVVGILSLFIASALGLPFAAAAFKWLKVEKPVISGVAVYTTIVFGFTLFMCTINMFFRGPAAVELMFACSMVAAGLVYGLLVRPLKHKLSSAKFVALTIGIALLPVLIWVLWRVYLTTIR